ncbi:MAG: glycosyltransferase family 4 protein [Sedimentisphaerales bacterium]|nr:glycosyltransferase family 4 protein [Sedimentisphaerales bacterium]
MQVMVAIENRFEQTLNGNIYSTTNCDYAFWSRYLATFDEVVVFARVLDIPEYALDKPPANGQKVSFSSLPTYIGPWQFIKHYRQIKKLTNQAVSEADAFILRTPGTLSLLLWSELRKRKIPYGLEVVAEPWEAMRSGNIKSIVRPFLRRMYRNKLIQQCKQASTVSYVTEHTLQKLYPATCWTTHYSSIELPENMIIADAALAERIRMIRERIRNKKPLRICNLAGMTGFYKGQNILIEAVSMCCKRGLDIKLTLIGDGRCKNTYVELVEKLGLSETVTFLGHILRGKQTNDKLDESDLFVFPSFTEGLPRGLIDAMARALPCIASDIGGIPELLSQEDLVPPRDAAALAAKIESVARDPEKMEKMARRNLGKSREYIADKLNHRRVEHYERLKEITESYYSSKTAQK